MVRGKGAKYEEWRLDKVYIKGGLFSGSVSTTFAPDCSSRDVHGMIGKFYNRIGNSSSTLIRSPYYELDKSHGPE